MRHRIGLLTGGTLCVNKYGVVFPRDRFIRAPAHVREKYTLRSMRISLARMRPLGARDRSSACHYPLGRND